MVDEVTALKFDLLAAISDMLVGKTFKHFKGNYYVIASIAISAVDCNFEVQYYRKNENRLKLWTRPLADFLAEVNKEKYPDSKQQYSFEPDEQLNNTYFDRVWLQGVVKGVEALGD